MPARKKTAEDKMSARLPVVMTPAQRAAYEAAASKHESVSAWIRQVLDAEVARLRRIEKKSPK